MIREWILKDSHSLIGIRSIPRSRGGFFLYSYFSFIYKILNFVFKIPTAIRGVPSILMELTIYILGGRGSGKVRKKLN